MKEHMEGDLEYGIKKKKRYKQNNVKNIKRQEMKSLKYSENI